MEKLITSSEAAEILDISTQTLARLAKQGEIARIQVGTQWRYRRSDLEAFLERNKKPVKSAA